MDDMPQDTLVVAPGKYRSKDTDLEIQLPHPDSVSDDALRERLIEVLEKSDLRVTTGMFDMYFYPYRDGAYGRYHRDILSMFGTDLQKSH